MINSPSDNETITDFFGRFFGGNKKQLKFLNSPKKFRCLIGGIGSGKTQVGATDLIRHSLKYPGSTNLLVAPTYKMLKKSSFEVLKKTLSWWGEAIDWTENVSDLSITFNNITDKNGVPSKIISGNAMDHDKLRGLEVSCIWIDEAAMISQDTWNILVGRIRQPGYPHRIWLSTTPRGKNWIYKLFVEDVDEDYIMFKMTSMDNPLYKAEPGYLETLVKSYGGEDNKFYKQEVLGEFVSFEGLVYDMFLSSVHTSDKKPKNPVLTVAGVDWGTSNFGCIIVIQLDKDGTIYVIDEIVKKGVVLHYDTEESWVDIAKELKQKYAITKFFADPSDPNAIQTFNLSGLDTIKANNSRIPGIREIQGRLQGNKIYINPECVNLLSEIESYEWRKDKNDKFLYDLDPVKINDHSLDALRYAVMGVAEVEEDETEEIIDLEDLLGTSQYIQKSPWEN